MSAANENPHAIAFLRMLNGPLQGAEYALSSGSTLLIMAGEEQLTSSVAPDLPSNSILLPLSDGVNVEIALGSKDGFNVREMDGRCYERECRYQEVIEVRSLAFAVRRSNEPWDAAIFRNKAGSGGVSVRGSKLVWWGTAMCALLLAVSGAAYYLSAPREAAALAQVIGGGMSYRVVEGTVGRFHVFALTERDASWARQALVRQGRDRDVRVAVQREEEKRMSHLLTEHFPGLRLHRIRLDDPGNPLLALSLERTDLDVHAMKTVKENLQRWMPYAKTIVIEHWSDELIDTRARQGLDRLGLSYVRKGGEAVTYRVRGNLDDAGLAAAGEFVAGFYQRYGNNYIHFSVELAHDDFNGKSFGYGQHHYVKQAPGHWQFL